MATNDGQNSTGSSTITTMFSFLIIFLVVFAALVIGGILWHHIARRRRARAGPGQVWFTFDEGWVSTYSARPGFGEVPKMWEISTPEGKGVDGKKWTVVQPLAVDVERSKEHGAPAAAPATEPARAQPPSLLARLRPHRSRTPEPVQAQPVQEEPPEYARAVQISVLVAMPSPNHNKAGEGRASPSSSSSSTIDLARLGEYAIGLCRVPLPKGTTL